MEKLTVIVNRLEAALLAYRIAKMDDYEKYSELREEYSGARVAVLDCMFDVDDDDALRFEQIVGDSGFLYGLDTDGGVWMFSHTEGAWGQLPDPEYTDEPELVAVEEPTEDVSDGARVLQCSECGKRVREV